MAKYCITAANHSNPNNHCASQFNMWKYDEVKKSWAPLGGQSINYVSDLLAAGHTVLSAKYEDKLIYTGAPVELELRIARNETQYNVSKMPTF